MRVVVLSVLVFLAAMPAQAASVEELFHQFDLFGTWAFNCALDAAPDNPHVRISTSVPGEAIEEQELGASYAINRYNLVAAERLSEDRLSVEAVFQPGTETQERQKLVFQVRKGTRRTLFNQTEGGAVRVKDGVVAGHGSKTPLLKKCG
jgi:hypothetical protein